jgi:hypothetical protein
VSIRAPSGDFLDSGASKRFRDEAVRDLAAYLAEHGAAHKR